MVIIEPEYGTCGTVCCIITGCTSCMGPSIEGGGG